MKQLLLPEDRCLSIGKRGKCLLPEFAALLFNSIKEKIGGMSYHQKWNQQEMCCYKNEKNVGNLLSSFRSFSTKERRFDKSEHSCDAIISSQPYSSLISSLVRPWTFPSTSTPTSTRIVFATAVSTGSASLCQSQAPPADQTNSTSQPRGIVKCDFGEKHNLSSSKTLTECLWVR